MDHAQAGIVIDGLEVARRVTDQEGECPPTAFGVRSGRVDWKKPLQLETPSAYAQAAQEAGVPAVVVVGSHALVDADNPESKLVRLYAGLVNARGEVLLAGKQQRWARPDQQWSAPSLAGPLPVGALEWSV